MITEIVTAAKWLMSGAATRLISRHCTPATITFLSTLSPPPTEQDAGGGAQPLRAQHRRLMASQSQFIPNQLGSS